MRTVTLVRKWNDGNGANTATLGTIATHESDESLERLWNVWNEENVRDGFYPDSDSLFISWLIDNEYAELRTLESVLILGE